MLLTQTRKLNAIEISKELHWNHLGLANQEQLLLAVQVSEGESLACPLETAQQYRLSYSMHKDVTKG